MLRGKGSKVQSLEMPRTEWTICDKSCDGGQTCATEPALRGLRCGLRASVPSVLVPCPKAQGPGAQGLRAQLRSRSRKILQKPKPGCKSCDAPGGPGGPGSRAVRAGLQETEASCKCSSQFALGFGTT